MLIHQYQHHISDPATCRCKNGEYLASSIDDSVMMCDEIVNAEDNISTNVPTYVMSTVSTNSYNKKVRYKMGCYILHTVLLVIILLFIITIICYRYAKHRLKCIVVLTI